jgi:SpoVK/Ycf46/Vps4 family AAA+-type ATPase
MKLDHVLKARIPLIAVHTNDVSNVAAILSHLISTKAKKKVFITIPEGTGATKVAGMIQEYGLFINPTDEIDFNKVYELLNAADKVLVLVNPDFTHDMIYDYGWVATPVKMIEDKLIELLEDAEVVNEFTPLLKELSLKQIEDVLKLASSIYGEISTTTINQIKKQYTKLSTGLHAVDTEVKFYSPIAEIEQWLIEQGSVLCMDIPKELKPRGLLFNGDPGTGKTFSAKRIATHQGVPLYRLDVSALKAKYVGESEKNMNAALKMLEVLCPCVLLIDEVEKLFGHSDDANTSQGLLSQLLWWLQEHSLSVLTIMTTNDKAILPPELYRPGRINKEIYFDVLSGDETLEFVTELTNKYLDLIIDYKTTKLAVLEQLKKTPVTSLTYANLTEIVYSEIRKQII